MTYTVLLEQEKSFNEEKAYEILGLDRDDVTVIEEEVDRSNQYRSQPYRRGAYYVEVEHLTDVLDGYNGEFNVCTNTEYGKWIYNSEEHDYEIEILNLGEE